MMLSGASSNDVTLDKTKMEALKQVKQTSITKAATPNNLQNYTPKGLNATTLSLLAKKTDTDLPKAYS